MARINTTKRGAPRGNKNAKKMVQKQLVSARISEDLARVADGLNLPYAVIFEALAECASALSHSAYKSDNVWVGVWCDDTGERHDTKHRALSAREATIAAGIEKIFASKKDLVSD